MGVAVKAGDDCVSIQTGCSNVNIRSVSCGPGHGISIGGLGRSDTKACVSNVTVQNVAMQGTMNGVRIKTWQVNLSRFLSLPLLIPMDSSRHFSLPIVSFCRYCNSSQWADPLVPSHSLSLFTLIASHWTHVVISLFPSYLSVRTVTHPNGLFLSSPPPSLSLSTLISSHWAHVVISLFPSYLSVRTLTHPNGLILSLPLPPPFLSPLLSRSTGLM